MSDKSRLESAEKLLVAHHRMFKEITKALEEAEKEFDRVYGEIEQTQIELRQLEEDFDERFPRDEGKQFLKCPNS